SRIERQPERLATLADSTMRLFTNTRYLRQAQKTTGIRFFDEQGQRRDPIKVLEEIKHRYDTLKTDAARQKFLFQAFGEADLDTI
ncbi:phage tail tape measure protein, partial [Salmonella enterica]|uniref:phage tail tape measure protein n=1 Tax=Salmonella enterica TaxID=28901 RepID=UPI0020A31425